MLKIGGPFYRTLELQPTRDSKVRCNAGLGVIFLSILIENLVRQRVSRTIAPENKALYKHVAVTE